MKRRGLTLLELVVVLAILAALSTVAFRTTIGLADQARHEATQRSLGQVEIAVFGDDTTRDSDGTLVYTGFLQDMGRLPRVYDDVPATPDPMRQLRELWTNDRDSDDADDFTPYAIQTPAGDSQLRIGAGWRGPYLQLAPGSSSLRDGWGRAFTHLKADDTIATNGETVASIISEGQDDAVDGTDYDADMEVDFGGRASGTVEGTVFLEDMSNPSPADGAIVVLRVYAPDPDTGNVWTHFQDEVAVSGGLVQYSIPDVPVGERVLRAYQVAVAPDPEDDLAGSALKSRPVRVVATPGARTRDLILSTD